MTIGTIPLGIGIELALLADEKFIGFSLFKLGVDSRYNTGIRCRLSHCHIPYAQPERKTVGDFSVCVFAFR